VNVGPETSVGSETRVNSTDWFNVGPETRVNSADRKMCALKQSRIMQTGDCGASNKGEFYRLKNACPETR
jgi:hypothetical protein